MKDFPSAYPKPDWLPDWRDETAYRDHGNDLTAWAWEFLRRNPEYQQDYARWAALPDTEECEDGKSRVSLKWKGNGFDRDDMKYFHDEPPAIPGETVGEYYARVGRYPDLLRQHICERWSIATPIPDPAKTTTPELYEDEPIPPYFIQHLAPEMDIGPRNPHFPDRQDGRYLAPGWYENADPYVYSCGIDLRFDIDRQLATLRQLLGLAKDAKLKDEADPLPKMANTPHRSKFLTRLRVLDAAWVEGEDCYVELVRNKLYDGKEEGAMTAEGRVDEQIRWEAAGKVWAERSLIWAVGQVLQGYKMLMVKDAFMLNYEDSALAEEIAFEIVKPTQRNGGKRKKAAD